MRKFCWLLSLLMVLAVFIGAAPATANVQSAPAANASFANSPLVIRVVDKAGKPVKDIAGMLELGVSDAGSEPPATALAGSGISGYCTGANGKLYFVDGGADMLPEKGTLILRAYYDSTIYQRIPIVPSAAKKEITVTWKGATPPSSAPDPATRRITFRIVDEDGKPVAGVGGRLEHTTATGMHGTRSLRAQGAEASAEAVSPYTDSQVIQMTDESGVLYAEMETGWEKQAETRTHRLVLYGYYDDSLSQTHKVTLPDPPASYKITWKKPLPPTERPPQTTGIRIFVVDTKGNPVEGVELSGSPYPKETKGDIPDIGMILPPSDKQGYIRFGDARPGTYKLYGISKDGKSQTCEVKMPKGKTMVDVTLIWNP